MFVRAFNNCNRRHRCWEYLVPTSLNNIPGRVCDFPGRIAFTTNKTNATTSPPPRIISHVLFLFIFPYILTENNGLTNLYQTKTNNLIFFRYTNQQIYYTIPDSTFDKLHIKYPDYIKYSPTKQIF